MVEQNHRRVPNLTHLSVKVGIRLVRFWTWQGCLCLYSRFWKR